MTQVTADKKMDVVNLYIKNLPIDEIEAGANVSADDVDAIIKEFMQTAQRLFELAQDTGKTYDEIIADVEELSQTRTKLLSDLKDMECMD